MAVVTSKHIKSRPCTKVLPAFLNPYLLQDSAWLADLFWPLPWTFQPAQGLAALLWEALLYIIQTFGLLAPHFGLLASWLLDLLPFAHFSPQLPLSPHGSAQFGHHSGLWQKALPLTVLSHISAIKSTIFRISHVLSFLYISFLHSLYIHINFKCYNILFAENLNTFKCLLSIQIHMNT